MAGRVLFYRGLKRPDGSTNSLIKALHHLFFHPPMKKRAPISGSPLSAYPL